jgi:hypothetical protein
MRSNWFFQTMASAARTVQHLLRTHGHGHALKTRGIHKTSCEQGTLREKPFGEGDCPVHVIPARLSFESFETASTYWLRNKYALSGICGSRELT